MTFLFFVLTNWIVFRTHCRNIATCCCACAEPASVLSTLSFSCCVSRAPFATEPESCGLTTSYCTSKSITQTPMYCGLNASTVLALQVLLIVPSAQVTYYMSWIPLIFGSAGAFGGGFISDGLSKNRGVKGRLLVLINCCVRLITTTTSTVSLSNSKLCSSSFSLLPSKLDFL